MQIETYEIEEINSSEAATMACDAESMELVEKLGLTGQKTLQNTGTGTRLPYRKLTALEALVFGTLFTARTKLEDYSSGIIPLRVLQIAAHCREDNLFNELFVWHPADVRKDPILVGFKRTDPRYDFMGDSFLLARWGEALENFEQLAAKASAIWLTGHRRRLAKIKADVESAITLAEEVAAEVFATGSVPRICFV